MWIWSSALGRPAMNSPRSLMSEPHILERQQGRISARAGRIRTRHPLRAKAGKVMRPARLRAGAGQALAAEGLRADDGADHRAVDVEIADRGALFDRLRGAG